MRRTTAAVAVALVLGTVALLSSNPQHTTKGTAMANPGIPSSQIPKGEDWVPRAFKDIEIQIRELTPSIARSIQPTVARLDAQDTAMAAQVAAIAANVASINSLLTQVVKPQSVHFDTTNFAVSTTSAAKVSQTITVPAGYTGAIVSIVARIHVYNPNTTGGWDGIGSDFFFCQAKIDSELGWALSQSLVGNASASAINICPLSKVLTGLTPGGTFVLAAYAGTVYDNWATNTGNAAEVTGSIVWTK